MLKQFGLFLLLSLSIKSSLEGQVVSLPLDDTCYRPLSETKNIALEKDLLSIVNEHDEWSKLVRQKKMSVGVVDLSDPSVPKYAAINGDNMVYAASLPKIAILLAVMDAIDKGEIQQTDHIDNLMHTMIRDSNNQSSTALIDLVGYEKIAAVLQEDKHKLYDKNGKGGLWVGKRYAAEGKRYPDPIMGLSHAATANQVCRFYYLLAYGKLINKERSEQMLDYLVDPHLHHKFVNSLDIIVPDAEVYRKSGTWKQYHADSVLVIGDEWRSYIIVALIESQDGERIMRNLLTEVDQLLYKYKS